MKTQNSIFLRLGLLLCITLFLTIASKSQTLRVTTSTVNNITKKDLLWYTPDEYRNYVFDDLNLSGLSTGYFAPLSVLSPTTIRSSSIAPRFVVGDNTNNGLK